MNFLSIFFLAITLVSFVVTLCSLPQQFKVSKHNKRFLFFYLLTIAATVGFFLAGTNLLVQFCFFEIMTLSSFAYVPNDESPYAKKAAFSYLAYGIAGGLAMLYGLMLLYSMFGTCDLYDIGSMWNVYEGNPENVRNLSIAGACLLFGYGAKAGMFPFHTWLPDTYTAAPPAGTALLSALLSKTGVYGILMMTITVFGREHLWDTVLMTLALCTMFVGGIFAIFATDMKKLLAYSSMSQIGFILFGISVCTLTEEAIGLYGMLLHTANHSIFKLILFTVAGVIFAMVQTTELNQIAGVIREKWYLKIPIAIAALGMGGVPLLSGYISKTMMHESLMEASFYSFMMPAAEWIFLFCGGLTVAYMLKLFMTLFYNKAVKEAKMTDEKKTSLPVLICLWALAAVVVAGGIIGLVLEPAAFLSLESLKGALISIATGIVLYFVIVRNIAFVKKEEGGFTCREVIPAWFGLENVVYRPFFLKLLPFLGALFSRLFDRFVDGFAIGMMKSVLRPKKPHVKREHAFAYGVGRMVDGISYVIQVKIRKKPAQKRHSYGDLFAVGSAEFSRTTRLAFYSVSFGLMMFAIGLMAALIYLLKVM
ncbi:MAG: complex I subunit 5 family protein [Eubacterium sp.]